MKDPCRAELAVEAKKSSAGRCLSRSGTGLRGLEEFAMKERIDQLRGLEGRQVSLALRDGSRIDDCQLVSAGRAETRSMWIFTQGVDVFLSSKDIKRRRPPPMPR
jgi:hypothetical protein